MRSLNAYIFLFKNHVNKIPFLFTKSTIVARHVQLYAKSTLKIQSFIVWNLIKNFIRLDDYVAQVIPKPGQFSSNKPVYCFVYKLSNFDISCKNETEDEEKREILRITAT